MDWKSSPRQTPDCRVEICIFNNLLVGRKLAVRAIHCDYISKTACLILAHLLQTIALFNSKVGELYLQVISPTLNLQVGDVKNIPLIIEQESSVQYIVDENVILSQNDWDSYETSWDFKRNPLI